jgi:hypothetical protein
MVLISVLPSSSGSFGPRTAALEALDAAPARDLALDSRVGRMAARADVNHELRNAGARNELVPARGAPRGRQLELRVCALHRTFSSLKSLQRTKGAGTESLRVLRATPRITTAERSTFRRSNRSVAVDRRESEHRGRT